MYIRSKHLRRALSLGLAIALGALSSGTASAAVGGSHPVKQSNLPADTKDFAQASCQDDVLLLMPDSKATTDQIQRDINGVGGKIVGTMGSGDLRVMVVETRKGQIAETEE